MSNRSLRKDILIPVLDHGVKPLLVMALCVVGFVFEFLVELPFRAILGFHRTFGRRAP